MTTLVELSREQLQPEDILAEIRSQEENARPDIDNTKTLDRLSSFARGLGISDIRILETRIEGLTANSNLPDPMKQLFLKDLERFLQEAQQTPLLV